MIKPLKRTLIIKKDIPSKKTKSGIILPNSMLEKSYPTGIIKYIGKNCEPFKVNQKVTFKIMSGLPFNFNGEILHYFLIEEITGIIDSP